MGKVHDHKWHSKQIACPTCDKVCSLVEVAFSADGWVILIGKCPKCSEFVASTNPWTKLLAESYLLDKKDEGTIQEGNDTVQ